ncbi:primosomal protein N' [Pseudoroseicyclus tamaricis]|uniref:Replication restart protein PriA n=1 Tax=Pseudoroseicyclus tamaricis TaxID=2705421 RepID=A0A6B2K241_9RHOB|nr:primosomal protein N' [Pseudoroseicyclus tamaricis]NDV01862.1 primosomal protein N' [Pseudoroseicyclus tamaricis]
MNDFFPGGARIAVLTTQPLPGPLDYLAPEGGLSTGAVVEVPLGPRRVAGVVWGRGEGDFPASKLRPVSRVLEAAPLTEGMRDFLIRSADYTLTPPYQMLRMALRAPGLGDEPAMRRVYRLGHHEPSRMTPPRQQVLAVMEEFAEAAFTLGELSEAAGVSTSVIKGLVKAGALREEEAPRDTPYPALDAARPGLDLTEDQAEAAARLREGVASGTYGTTLLRGVTGSGKTEVYLEAVAECLARGRQALVLLPEIALTGAFLARVEERFGAKAAEWHSGITMTERRRLWKMVGEGGAELVVGARSALFLPFRELGLIVVDEEHDTSYKQEEGVLYNARDMAVLRASLSGGRVILASATPSLESWVNAEQGKYERLDLTSRFGPAVMPKMRAIDMRAEPMSHGTWISPSLAAAVEARMEKGEQSLLFLNRRGYAPVTLCRACGEQVACRNCDARMVEHRFLKRLMCHQCGETIPVPTVCPSCEVEGKLAALGPGVERLAEEVTARFPEARLAVLSSDLFGSARALKAAIEEIAAGAADIVIGTQLVAKGHNFPLLTLVGVIDSDLGLQGSDLRAAEKTFQLIRQVAGRAGRAEAPGEALLQTFQPEHPVIRAILSGEEERFWAAEAAERKAAGAPPFGRMAGLILSSPDLQATFDIGNLLARNTEKLRAIGAEVYGPAPAPIARVRGRHRVRLLVKAAKSAPLQQALAEWVAPVKLPANFRLAIDIDPQSFW